MNSKKAGIQEGKKPGPTPKTADEWRAHYERQNAEYFQKVERLAHKIASLFREHWPNRSRYPDRDACSVVAKDLQIVADTERKPDPPSVELGEAGRYAGLFLKHAPAALIRIAKKLDWMQAEENRLPPALHPERDRMTRLRAAIHQAEAAMKAIKDIEQPNPIQQINACQFVADSARKAWQTTGEEVSLAVSHGDAPLCRFISSALAEINLGQPGWTVSEHLRADKQPDPVKTSSKMSPETRRKTRHK